MQKNTTYNPIITEKHLSQIPALQLLINCGYQILSPEEVATERQGKRNHVLLEHILCKQLTTLNRIHYKGKKYHFSEANIQEAIQKIKHVTYNGLLKTNEAIYDLITLGTALEQSIEGNLKSFNLHYIDWKTPSNNVFHVVPEFSVERNRSTETARPDIVLFVNGIPLAVIECKSPTIPVEQGISQHIRNQGDDYIPLLFTYSQLLISINKNAAKYATTVTPAKFWSIWNELEDKEERLIPIINTPLSEQHKWSLYQGEFKQTRSHFDYTESKEDRQLTKQDKTIYSLCRPERLLDLIYNFTLFDAGIKKIARYQQFFVTRSTLARIQHRPVNGQRTGGVIWHTQGSGKSLTMVMLTRALALNTTLTNPRIILVTDRDDLDKQLGNTFIACGLSTKRAASGRNLVKHLKNKVGIITTLIHKFEKGWTADNYTDPSPDIFVLVDESHRTNFGSLAARMRQMLPNACYLGFTGTPLYKKEKNNFSKFGGMIEPHYSIRQAVEDNAVLPLLYEGRHVEMIQDQSAIDLWFNRHTAGLTDHQKTDLKKKYARAEMLTKSDQVIYMRAFDISEHYRANWKGTGFKAQLVAPSKAAALQYHKSLNEIGFVVSEVIMSPPDTREGHEEVDEGTRDDIGKFWNKMMTRFGSEEDYTKKLINQFKNREEPEILIVVDKLLTGFDAPKNTVLYLCRKLREHTLLQAIARVNRLHEGKEFGYIIDYASILGELDNALHMYDELSEFDEDDLLGTLTSVHEEVELLSQRYSDLWGVFKEVSNKHDEEAFEIHLADDALREDFYETLSQYSKTLGIALSTENFMMKTDEDEIKRYKKDLKWFQNLKKSVKLRYAESIDYRDYEPKIKKLLDTHIQANEAIQLNKPINIFDKQHIDEIKQGQGIQEKKSTASKADTIAHATKKVITEKMEEDPAFYEEFSKLIQQAIDDFKAGRLSDLDYLHEAETICDAVRTKKHRDVPDAIRDNDQACAYYGVIKPYFMTYTKHTQDIEWVSMETSLAIQRIMERHWKVDFWMDEYAQKSAVNAIEDFLYDEVKLPISTNHMDAIIEKTIQISKNRNISS